MQLRQAIMAGGGANNPNLTSQLQALTMQQTMLQQQMVQAQLRAAEMQRRQRAAASAVVPKLTQSVNAAAAAAAANNGQSTSAAASGNVDPAKFREQIERIQAEEKKKQQCRVYVGSIPYGLNEEHIKLPFSAFGPIVRIDMPKEPMTNRSKGFCFIEYAEPSAAKQALATMNGFELHGRQLKVNIPMSAQPQSAAAVRPRIALLNPIMIAQQAAMSGIDPSVALLQAQMQQRQQQMQASRPTVQAGPKTRIYVGSVFYNLKTDHVREVFESFGKITSCELIPNPENGLHKGYGFIEFERQEDAQEAIDNMNGFELCSRPIKVGWASVQPTAATTTASAPAPPQPAPAAAAAAVAALASRTAAVSTTAAQGTGAATTSNESSSETKNNDTTEKKAEGGGGGGGNGEDNAPSGGLPDGE